MTEPTLYIDFETRSAADLRSLGADVYARHQTTDILCLGYAFDDEQPRIWYPGMPTPVKVMEHVQQLRGTVSHNAPFELAIWNNVGVKRYGWPRLDPVQAYCSMSMAYAMALPGSLDRVSNAMGLTHVKDMAGHRLMMQLSQPREILPDGTPIWWEDIEKFERLYEYCVQDVVVEREVYKKLLKLSPKEHVLWVFDQRINQRGLRVDVKKVRSALEIVELEQKRLHSEMQRVTRNAVATCQAVSQLADYLRAKGVSGFDGVAKADILKLLARTDLPADVRQALLLRQEAAKSSTKKLKPMAISVCPEDDRLRGIFQYHAASTGRWAGRRVQPHNFPRPKLKQGDIDRVLGILDTHPQEAARDLIELLYGSPMSVLADCLRGMLVPAPGFEFIGADLSSIEARKLAWLAGEEPLLRLFRNNEDVYRHAASAIYGVEPGDVTDEQRQVGKVAVLALGYQGGVGAFQSMAKNYNVTMAPAFPLLWERATAENRDKAEWGFEQRGSKFDISREEFLASELTKLAWRDAHPQIVAYWYALERAVLAAVANKGQAFKAGAPGREITYKVSGSFLFCRLPSGRVLSYPYPRIEAVKGMDGKSTKEAVTAMGEDSTTGKFVRFKMYGGLACENVVQASSRCILSDAMIRLETSGFPIVLHVHDEAVAEVPIGTKRPEDFEKLMTTLPAWAKDLPVAAKAWRGRRYQK